MLLRARIEEGEQSGLKRLDPAGVRPAAESAHEPLELDIESFLEDSAPLLTPYASDLDDEFADEKTPVMGVRVVFGGDGQVESVVPFESDAPPPSKIDGLAHTTLLPPPLDEDEQEAAIPLTRRRPRKAPHPRSRVARWAVPVASALVGSALTVAAMKWLPPAAEPPPAPVPLDPTSGACVASELERAP
jgi:hypothetical protein